MANFLFSFFVLLCNYVEQCAGKETVVGFTDAYMRHCASMSQDKIRW